MKKAIIGAGILVAACVGALVWRLQPVRETFFTDADQIREPAGRAAPRDVLWQPPSRLLDVINTTTADDYEPKISADGLTLFFVRGKAGGHADIYTARRTPAGWTTPEPLTVVNSKYDELGPEPSADG